MKPQAKSLMLLVLVAAFRCKDGAPFCPKNKKIAHATIDYSNYSATGNATVICDAGYMIQGSSIISCRNWQWTEVECILIDCGTTYNLSNGQVRFAGKETLFNQTISVACDTGYELRGESEIKCLSDGSWSTNTTCEIIDCGITFNITNGHVNITEMGTTVNQTVSVICDPGYRRVGEEHVTCNADGTWGGNSSCQIKDCGTSLALPNVIVNFDSRATTFNETVPVSCSYGYQLKDQHFITCLQNGSWSEDIECELKEETRKDYDILIIFVIVLGIITVTCVILVIYLRRSGKVCLTKKIGDSELDQLDFEIKVWTKFKPGFIKREDFPAYVDVLHKVGNKLFADGFRLLDEESPSHPTTVAESKACRSKIRFSNVLPFDHSRVQLTPVDGEERSDFINANFIPGYSSGHEYIATQAPFAETRNDFWRMIWEYNVDIIVMLTKRLEIAKASLPRNYRAERHWVVPPSDQYWPDEVQGPVYYGNIIVNTTSESVLSDHVTRVMEITKENETRSVTHIHFLRWPEQGCPKRYWPFLNFVTMVRQYLPRQMVVHCSTGIGRTGTFIAVDRLLQQIKENDELDPYSVILNMRNSRSNMVKTLEQFIYVYECIRHFLTLEEDYEDEDDDASQYTGNGQYSFNNHAFEKAKRLSQPGFTPSGGKYFNNHAFHEEE